MNVERQHPERPTRFTPWEVIRDALARVVTAREWVEDGDIGAVATLLYSLELDLAGYLEMETA
jgi:hypothetical protein